MAWNVNIGKRGWLGALLMVGLLGGLGTVGRAYGQQAAPPPEAPQQPADQHPEQTPSTERPATLGVVVERSGDEKGIRIVDVRRGSPAARAALRPGDQILEVNGQAIESVRQLADLVRGLKPNDRLELKFTRNGRERTREIRLGLAAELRGRREDRGATPPRLGPQEGMAKAPDAQAWLGIRLREGGEKGALAVGVYPGGPADQAGVTRGDRIVRIQDTDVAKPEDLVTFLAQSKPDEDVNLGVVRQGKEQTIKVTLGSLADFLGAQFRGQGPQRQGREEPSPEAQMMFEQGQRIEQTLREMQDDIRQLREEVQKLQSNEQGEDPHHDQQTQHEDQGDQDQDSPMSET